MKSGHFCFISDNFYATHDPEKLLMQNKEQQNGQLRNRPCFLAFPDQDNSQIFWCVPISSKLDKFKTITSHKLKQMARKGIKHPVCDTIRFGTVMGSEKAFLIQNMFPITEKYITNTYIDNNTNNEVTIAPPLEADIIKRARKVLSLTSRGIPLIFGDVQKIYHTLEAELEADRTVQKQPVQPDKKVFTMSRKTMTQNAEQLRRIQPQREQPAQQKAKAEELE